MVKNTQCQVKKLKAAKTETEGVGLNRPSGHSLLTLPALRLSCKAVRWLLCDGAQRGARKALLLADSPPPQASQDDFPQSGTC